MIILCIVATMTLTTKTPKQIKHKTITKINNFNYVYPIKTNEIYSTHEHILCKPYNLNPSYSHKPVYYYDDSIIPLSAIRYISGVTNKSEKYTYDKSITGVNNPQKQLIKLYKLNQPEYKNILDTPVPNILK